MVDRPVAARDGQRDVCGDQVQDLRCLRAQSSPVSRKIAALFTHPGSAPAASAVWAARIATFGS